MITLYKNGYDILTATPTPRQLEEKMEAILEVCLKKNVKLSPLKFQCARQVTIEALKHKSGT